MNDNDRDELPGVARHYLRVTESELADVPAAERERVLAEAEDRLREAHEAERPVVEVMAELGAPAAVAADLRARLGITRTSVSTQGARVWMAIGLAALLLVVAAIAYRAAMPVVGGVSLATMWWAVGAMVVALGAASVPERYYRQAVLLAAAVVLCGSTLTFDGASWLLFAPVYPALALALLVPNAVGVARRQRMSLVWRILAAAMVLAPLVVVMVGLVTGSLGMDAGGWAIVAVLAVVIVGIMLAKPAAYIALVGLGLLTIIFGVAGDGFLLLGTWWIGGLYVTVGLALTVLWWFRDRAAAAPADAAA